MDADELARIVATVAPAGTHAGLPDEFWRSRPVLEHVRRAAWARQRSAAAVLHVVLARVAACVPHTLELPPIVGSPAGLSYFAALIAPPGVGKSSASDIAAELVPIDDPKVADQLPLGSGEGLVEVLFDLVDEPDADGKTRRVKRQVRWGAYIYADEGQVLADLGRRNGATLLPTLRTIWTGGTVGQANASSERKRIVPAGQYTYGVVLGLQDGRAGALLDDAAAGTPQRFGWAHATDPDIPDRPPEWPGPLEWSLPTSADLADLGGTSHDGYLRHRLHVDPAIVCELRHADLARARGHHVTDDLDAHAGLLRLKVAGLLAILGGRLDISADDWHLAGAVKTASDQVRDDVLELVAAETAARERQTSERLAARAVAADSAVERRRIVETAQAIAVKVHDGDSRYTTARGVRGSLSATRRAVFDDALQHAIAEGWVVEELEPSHTGDPQRTLRPGTRRTR